MWVLTLTQPYAWMVVDGPKDLENRGWVNRIVRELLESGMPFAIHAGKTMTKKEYREAVAFAAVEDPDLVVPPPEELVYGAILGTAKIRGIYTPDQWRPHGRAGHFPWHMRDKYGWSLAGRTPLPSPVFIGGKQGFWQVDDDLLRAA